MAVVTESEAATALLDPRKERILAAAREPASATEIARGLGLPRQRVHYHVRELERAGLLRPAGRRRRRNLVEQRFVATSRSYALAPELLGALAADWREVPDARSPAYLLALTEQVRSDLARLLSDAEGAATESAPTMSLKAQFRLETEAQRTAFLAALREAVVTVIARHTSPDRREGGRTGGGRVHRLLLACYPLAGEEPPSRRESRP
jgi:DNA-binding transcriptional ArsR family regulator